ncbi:MAG: TetR/AcrR family transcriptional regulator [Myxococcota bacterium]
MPRPKNTEERRLQIVQGLIQVMAQRGYDGASVAQVAAAAKLSPGLVHYHFKSKGEILLGALEHLVKAHEARVEEALEGAGSDAQARLNAFIDAHLALGPGADRNALACWILFSGEALRSAAVQAPFEQALERQRQVLESILDEGARSGAFRCGDRRAAAVALVASIQGYFVLAGSAPSLIPQGTAARSVRAMAVGLLSAGGEEESDGPS